MSRGGGIGPGGAGGIPGETMGRTSGTVAGTVVGAVGACAAEGPIAELVLVEADGAVGGGVANAEPACKFAN